MWSYKIRVFSIKPIWIVSSQGSSSSSKCSTQITLCSIVQMSSLQFRCSISLFNRCQSNRSNNSKSHRSPMLPIINSSLLTRIPVIWMRSVDTVRNEWGKFWGNLIDKSVKDFSAFRLLIKVIQSIWIKFNLGQRTLLQLAMYRPHLLLRTIIL